jgi:hypothetical protein
VRTGEARAGVSRRRGGGEVPPTCKVRRSKASEEMTPINAEERVLPILTSEMVTLIEMHAMRNF